jgi:RNA polymerase sigma-B factor
MMPTAPLATGSAAVAAPRDPQVAELPLIADASAVSPADARSLSKLFFDRLQFLEEGTHEYQYARNTLIEMNMSLVHFAARRFGRRGEVEDMIQVGMIGLIKAIDRFELTRENEFTTFAVPYIVGEIKRFFRDTTWAVHVPRRLQELRTELARAKDVLGAKLGRDPAVAELAAHLDRSEDEVVEGLIAANGYTTDSLDMPYDSGDGSAKRVTFADTFGACDPSMELVEDLTSLAPLVSGLDDRERRILRMRFGEELTQAQIGEALGVSQMHVSRLLAGIIGKLRKELLPGV